MGRVLNFNAGFDISSTTRLNFLSVFFSSRGHRINQRWGIKNSTIPDLLSFMQQKRSVVWISETDDNNCLITALGIGHERSLEAAHEAQKTKKISYLKTQSAATNRPINQILAENQLTDSFTLKYGAKWTLEEDTEKLSEIAPLKNYAIFSYDRKTPAAFVQGFNEDQQKHTDLLNNQDGVGHVDFITTKKGLLMARFYCYTCHRAYSTSKYTPSTSSSVLMFNVKSLI